MTGDIWSVPGRSTRAVIDLDAIEGNLRRFRQEISPATRLMAVVKANGYGHGAVMIAQTALAAGATDLAVATVDEGLQLRKFGIDAPILVLSPIDDSEFESALAGNLSLVVADRATVRALALPRQPARPHRCPFTSRSIPECGGMVRLRAMPSRSHCSSTRWHRSDTWER